MARNAIIEKLEGHLREDIRTEAAVVYLLVELRKLMEHDKSKSQFPVLNFYCNWVVHTKLDASPIADKIIRLFDDMQAYMVSAKNAPAPIKELKSLLDQSSLRAELWKMLKRVGLPAAPICGSTAAWNSFQRLLGAVIEDVPLLIHKERKQATLYVDSIAVRNLPLEGGKSFNLEWTPKFHNPPQGKLRPHPGLKPRNEHPNSV
jgi:hypothetical protein